MNIIGKSRRRPVETAMTEGMKAFTEPLLELHEFEEALQLLKSNQGVLEISGCTESQKAHMIYGLSGLFACVLIIADDEQRARELYEDYRFFDKNVCYYPPKDLLFFQADVHGNLLIRQRMSAIKALLERQEGEHVTVITTIDGCMDHLMPVRHIQESMIRIRNDSTLDVHQFRKQLTALGYELTAQAEMPGQFSVRGGIIDVYGLTEQNPWRIELWDDEVDSIRSFDAESQRSIENLTEITICPAAESFAKKGMVIFPEYFPENTLFVLDEPNHLEERAHEIEEEYSQSRRRREELGGQNLPETWLAGFDRCQKYLNRSCTLALSSIACRAGGWRLTQRLQTTVKSAAAYHGGFSLLVEDLKKYRTRGYRTIVLSGSRTRAERLAGDLQNEGLTAFYGRDYDRVLSPGEIMVMYGHVGKGFEYPLIRFAVITETDIFGQEQKPRKKKKHYDGQRIRNFSELSPGDYVVHENHGLGIYRGLEKIEVDLNVRDYIKIEYAGGSFYYILPTQLETLQKYSASDGQKKPKLNTLGSKEWIRTRTRVKKEVRSIAKELVELYAARQQKNGYVCGPDTVWQREFEEMFPYEETEDQVLAIEETKKDMESDKIMDRLICGDVGYGKTEIALRAAFKEVQESRQVVYLVPTTILAQQHYNTFCQRMKDFPVQVDLLCRFRTPAQQKKTIEGLKKGSVDIVIGTHRVLSKDITFKNLGLLIIDEEQRFGVTHKEKIKQLRKNVDVLTLTATPIPRTLHMSLIGIRDMSVLEEPPIDRMPIQTYVMEYDNETVREAISREIRRGGQVFYVYNRVTDIGDVTYRLKKLLPELQIEYAHGQMPERQLENVMLRFINKETDVLVTTTIIETGLDISNANTMIIHDSDRYGLAQLYQLRGRIGRSNRTAYAFLMYNRNKILTETAEKRLAAIREYTDLGSGFKIALQDLELRGAGNLLGAEQHGHMADVGYDMYCKMLTDAVREAKGEEDLSEFETSIDLNIDAYIPDFYIENESQKLDIYKRISIMEDEQDYDDMVEELLDRFGELPKAVLTLLSVARLKIHARKAYVTEIKQVGSEVRIRLYEQAKIDPARIPAVIARYRRRIQFRTDKEPVFFLKPEGKLLEDLNEFCRNLSGET